MKHNLDENKVMFQIITLYMTFDTDLYNFHEMYLENKTIHRNIQMFMLHISSNLNIVNIIIFILSRFTNGLQ